MHTAVTGVRTTKTLGDAVAKGAFYVVKVKVFSDARRATLGLLSVEATVLDDAGNLYQRDLQTETQLSPQPPFEQKISGVGSFEKQIVFDLPADVIYPRLDIRDGYGIDHLIEAVLVDDEDSVLHKRQFFELQEPKPEPQG